MTKKIKNIIKIAVIVSLLLGIFFIVNSKNKNKNSSLDYTLDSVEFGSISSYVEGDGKVSSENELDIKSKVSTNVKEIKVKSGDEVKKGQLLLTLDDKDARKGIRDLQSALNSASLTLEKMKSLDNLSLQEAETSLEKLKLSQKNTYDQAIVTKTNAENALSNSYTNAINNIDYSYSNFATIIDGFRTILYLSDNILPQDITGNTTTDQNLIDMDTVWNVETPKYWQDILTSGLFDSVSDKSNLENLVKIATSDYKKAKYNYNNIINEYRQISKYSSNETIETFLQRTITLSESISQSSRSLNNLYDFWIDYNNARKRTLYYNITTYNTRLKGYSTTINTIINNLISSKNGAYGIDTSKTNLQNAISNIETLEKNQPLDLKSLTSNIDKIKSGANKIDIKLQQNAVTQRLNALNDAISNLEDYNITAPFDGVIGSMNLDVGDFVMSSMSLTKVISNTKIANISINESDSVKIKTGQKVELTFDAINDLKIEGEIIEINELPTADQTGVVSYSVKISFDDKSDKRIKSGMNIYAKIILETKSDVYNIRTTGVQEDDSGKKYIEFFNANNVIEKKYIETGIENFDRIEINNNLSDIKEILIRTVRKPINSFSSQSMR